jgi:hypothetical protein
VEIWVEIGFVFRDLGGDLLGSYSEGGRIVDGAWEEEVKVVCDGGERTVWVESWGSCVSGSDDPV